MIKMRGTDQGGWMITSTWDKGLLAIKGEWLIDDLIFAELEIVRFPIKVYVYRYGHIKPDWIMAMYV